MPLFSSTLLCDRLDQKMFWDVAQMQQGLRGPGATSDLANNTCPPTSLAHWRPPHPAVIGRPLTPLPSLDPGLDSIGRPLTPCLASKAWEAGRHLVSSNPANHQDFILSWSVVSWVSREKSALLPLKYKKIGVPSPRILSKSVSFSHNCTPFSRIN